jgi:hypothetical protein
MRVFIITCSLMVLLVGCTARPSAADQAAIRQRVDHFKQAWQARDAAGAGDSIALTSPQASEFFAAQVDVLAAQQRVQKAVDSVWSNAPWNAFPPPVVRDLVPSDLDSYAKRTVEPEQKMLLNPKGTVQVIDSSKHELFMMRRNDGGIWKIDPSTFGDEDDLRRKTNWARDDIAFADDMAAAIASGSTQRFQQVMHHQIAILGRRAIENPP